MRVSSFISFFFFLGTIALAAPVRSSIMLSIHTQHRTETFMGSTAQADHANDLNMVNFWLRIWQQSSLVF